MRGALAAEVKLVVAERDDVVGHGRFDRIGKGVMPGAEKERPLPGVARIKRKDVFRAAPFAFDKGRNPSVASCASFGGQAWLAAGGASCSKAVRVVDVHDGKRQGRRFF